MPIFDKFKNKVFRKKLEQRIIEKRDLKITPEEVIEAVVEAIITDTSLIQRSKTLQRLDILEALGVWSTTSILKNNGDIANNKDAIAAIQNKLPTQDQLDRAKYVWDSTDNSYKNVKSIVINNANNADRVWDPGSNTYVTITDLSIHKHLLPLTGGVITGDLEINGVLTNREVPVATQDWVRTNFSPKEEGSSGRDDIVTINTVQTITAKKTFSEVISQPTTPTEDDHVVNKKYVDDAIKQSGGGITPDNVALLDAQNNFTGEENKFRTITFSEYIWSQVGDKEFIVAQQRDNGDGTVTLQLGAPKNDVELYYTGDPKSENSVVTKKYTDNTYYTLKDGEDLYNHYIDLNEHTLRLNKPMITQTVQGSVEFKTMPLYTGDIASRDLPDNALITKAMIRDGIRKNVLITTREQQQTVVGPVDFKIAPTVNGQPISASIDSSNYVRKDVGWQELCSDPCQWASDLQTQINSNGAIVGKMWDSGKIGGAAFGNTEQNIATQEWVKQELEGMQADSNNSQREGHLAFVDDIEVTLAVVGGSLSGVSYRYTFERDISDWIQAGPNNGFKLVGLQIRNIHNDDADHSTIHPVLKNAVSSVFFDDKKMYGTLWTDKPFGAENSDLEFVITRFYKHAVF